MKHAVLAAAVFATALLCPPAAAGECRPAVVDGWLRMPPAAMPMLAGFARIENGCRRPATLVAVRSAAFADVSLHETRIENGVSRMRALPTLAIAPRGAMTLAPGGLHLMLMRPTSPVKPGDTVRIEFEFADGAVVRAVFAVRPIAG